MSFRVCAVSINFMIIRFATFLPLRPVMRGPGFSVCKIIQQLYELQLIALRKNCFPSEWSERELPESGDTSGELNIRMN